MFEEITAELKTAEDKVSYGLGWQFGRHLQTHNFEGLDLTQVFRGMRDCFADKAPALTDADVESAFKLIADKVVAQRAEQAEIYGAMCAAFLADNMSKNGVQMTPSGLQFELQAEGTGKACGPLDTVEVHYHGTLVDGTCFDSSILRGQPLQVPVQGVISGWTEALQLMSEGSKLRLYVPEHLAYGEAGKPPKIPGKAALIFDLELIRVL